MLKEQEMIFANEYIINGGNIYQAALAAGYSKNTAVHSSEWLRPPRNPDQKRHLPYKPELREYINGQLAKIESDKTATAQEVMEYLTAVLRGESRSEIVVVEGTGEGKSEARTMEKAPDEKERLKAAATLSQIMGLGQNNLNMNGVKIVIGGENAIED